MRVRACGHIPFCLIITIAPCAPRNVTHNHTPQSEWFVPTFPGHPNHLLPQAADFAQSVHTHIISDIASGLELGFRFSTSGYLLQSLHLPLIPLYM